MVNAEILVIFVQQELRVVVKSVHKYKMIMYVVLQTVLMKKDLVAQAIELIQFVNVEALVSV